MQDALAIRYIGRQAVNAKAPWSDHTLQSRKYQTQFLLNALTLALALIPFSLNPALGDERQNSYSDPLSALVCTPEFNKGVLDKVVKHVREGFYSKKISENVWPGAIERQKAKILASKNMLELSEAINAALDELKSSHCRFLTINDDTFYFLHSLFSNGRANPKASSVFPGFITGGVGFAPDRVRYVLNNSPADKAHIQVGDKIISVDGNPFIGQANFFLLDNKSSRVYIERDGKPLSVSLTLKKRNMYEMYCEAVEKSANVFDIDGKRVGYVHLWCGGGRAQDELAATLDSKKLKDVDGLILDLRDGYGACSLDALDPFYRNSASYPDFECTSRSGKISTSRLVFDKPVVAIINGGSRSGKEALAYSLKKTRRAKLIGDRTAGYFLAGSVKSVNDKCDLYLAVMDCALAGVRLEGTGVEPDVIVQNDKTNSEDKQLEAAKAQLIKELKLPKDSPER